MADGKNARTRLIAIIEALSLFSDESTPISAEDLCKKLKEMGYEINKRTLISDIKLLKTTSVIIDQIPGEGYIMRKAYTESTINSFLLAAYSSEILSEEAIKDIENYLRKNTRIGTYDLINDTTTKISSVSPHERCPEELVSKLRKGIFNKKKLKITILRAVPGDSFDYAKDEETLIVNPIRIGVVSDALLFIFSIDGKPEEARCMHLCRIKDVHTLDEPSVPFTGDIKKAIGYFMGATADHRNREPSWFLVRFRTEYLEFVRNHFSHPIQFKKDDEEGYCLAKINAVFDERLVGWLFHFGDRVELLGPKPLKDYFTKQLAKKFAQFK